jgi:hypothetical protein
MATISGGKKLEAELRRIGERITRPGTLRVGFLENARYPDGTPVAMIAAIHNFGAPRAGIPPRPFFSNMIANKSGEWPKAIAALLRQHDYDAPRSLDIAGAAIAGQLRQSIVDTNSPPLAPSTIKRKGFAKPLIFSGHMWQSVDHEVRA